MRFSGGTQLLKGFKSLKIQAYISPKQIVNVAEMIKLVVSRFISKGSAHSGEISSHLALPDGGNSQIISSKYEYTLSFVFKD